MPRAVSLYNGQNQIDNSVVTVNVSTDGVTADRRNRRVSTISTNRDKSNEDNNKIAMAVEFDHMYLGGGGCSDTKASISKDLEVQHLKDLLLLHLDLIQQQAEQLVAKDKIIKSLRDENENLKSRLDRIDRRVSLSLNKKSHDSSILEIKPESSPEDGHSDSLPRRLCSPISRTVELLSPKHLSPNRNTPCTKSHSPSNKLLSVSNKPGSPSTKASSPQSKPASPSSKHGSPPSKLSIPLSKPGSPSCKIVSPPSKPKSPAGKPESPPSKPGSPPSKPGSPPSKPGSPPSRLASPTGKPTSPNSSKLESSPSVKATSPANKLQSPNNKAIVTGRKSVSPQAKISSPQTSPPNNNRQCAADSKSPNLPSRVSSPPHIKASSPPPKIELLHKVIEDYDDLPGGVSDSQSNDELLLGTRSGSSPRLLRRPSPRSTSRTTSPRERRQRNASQSQSSENDTEIEPLKDFSKSDKERSRLKRKSDSETEGSPVKRIRPDRDRTSSSGSIHVKDDGLTDHNLRSRDKSKDSVRTGDAKSSDDLPESPGVARATTPTPRAAALEAKKLRQKLQLRGKTPPGATVRADGVLNTAVSYYLPYGTVVQEPNPEEEECLQSQVEIPRWGTRILTSLYVMEGTENLEDEIFLKRHAKPEQDEKRRKRWDLQRMREQRHYERLRERYESRQPVNEPTASNDGSLWPCPESAMYLHIEDTLPVCAFGQPLARIPPQEFTIPWLSGPSSEGVTTRRRKR